MARGRHCVNTIQLLINDCLAFSVCLVSFLHFLDVYHAFLNNSGFLIRNLTVWRFLSKSGGIPYAVRCASLRSYTDIHLALDWQRSVLGRSAYGIFFCNHIQLFIDDGLAFGL